MADEVKLHFAGLLTRQVRNADGLANLLSGYLGRRVRVEQFAGHWMPLLPEERSRLGRVLGGKRNTSAQLGGGAVLGSMLWDRQHGIRLHIGPLDRKAFESLLPDGTALPAVMALVQQYLGHEFDWDLVLGHVAEQVEPSRLGRHARLGWTSWIGKPKPDPQGVAGLRLAPEQAMKAWQRRKASAEALPTPRPPIPSSRRSPDRQHEPPPLAPPQGHNTMAEISRVAVFGKLNPLVYKAVEGATVFCKLRGNPYVELEHWIAQIVQNPDSDWHRIIQHYGLDVSVLAKDITTALDRLPRGATAISDISDNIDTRCAAGSTAR
jgi:hypothetical protein